MFKRKKEHHATKILAFRSTLADVVSACDPMLALAGAGFDYKES
jgi:hypothetical protein